MPTRPSPLAALRLLVPLALSFVGCQSTAKTLTPRGTFDVHYEGRVEPAQPAEAKDPFRELVVRTGDGDAGDGDSVLVRATLVEVPADEVRALLPEWSTSGTTPRGATLHRSQFRTQLQHWKAAGAVVDTPLLAVGYEKEGSFQHLDQAAYVSRFDLVAGHLTTLGKPTVSVFQDGYELSVHPRQKDGEATVAIEWQSRDRLAPIAYTGRPHLGSVQLPLVLEQRLAAELPVHAPPSPPRGDVPPSIAQLLTDGGVTYLLGSTPTTSPDVVRLVFVELDEQSASAAATALLAADASPRK